MFGGEQPVEKYASVCEELPNVQSLEAASAFTA